MIYEDVIKYKRLGVQLQRLRVDAQLGINFAAFILDISNKDVLRIELGINPVPDEDAAALFECYQQVIRRKASA